MGTMVVRNRAIDQFRGVAILLMFAANYMEHIAVVPAWLKHAPGIGLTAVDFIAPFFIFAIGLSFGPSSRRFKAMSARSSGRPFS